MYLCGRATAPGAISHTGAFELFLVPAQYTTTGIAKAVVCTILSVRWCI